MGMTDSLGDMVARLRNALRARHAEVNVPVSKIKKQVAEILVAEGFVEHVTETNEFPAMLTLKLKYDQGQESVIRSLRRISRPGQRKYVGKEAIPKVCSGLGIAILSTSKGIMTDRQARKLGVGGEVLCEVW